MISPPHNGHSEIAVPVEGHPKPDSVTLTRPPKDTWKNPSTKHIIGKIICRFKFFLDDLCELVIKLIL